MPVVDIVKKITIARTPRVMQLEGLFDVPKKTASEFTLELDCRIELRPWNVGLIVGPSGSGKTSIANELFGEHYVAGYEWPKKNAIVDAFPKSLGIKDITGLLSSVGFSSPPHWLKPFGVLSNGEQFRATIARALAEQPECVCIDEFTSVVDRQIAKVASAAVAKSVRARNQRFVAVSCHYDVEDWLQPDWVIDLSRGLFEWRRLRRRPDIAVDIARADVKSWPLFAPHHYLTGKALKTAYWFLASVAGRPVAIASAIYFPHAFRPSFREHRLVTLPDWQGVGIGNALSAYVGSLFRARGLYRSVTSHPAMIAQRCRSPLWKMIRKPSLCGQAPTQHLTERGVHQVARRAKKSGTNLPGVYGGDRMTAGFEYVGPANEADAKRFGVVK